ncbi:MAG: amidohydrolase [Sandaracinaceae bacterium]|nr:amidohydrolase [Sandaracinaceae bacterium]
MTRAAPALALAIVAASCGASSPVASPRGDDALVLIGEVVIPDAPTGARALRIADGRITHVLTADDPALSGRRERVEGVILPGLVDAHLHLAGLGRARRTVDLRGTRSEAEVVARVAEAARGLPSGTWIRARGWDQNDWDDPALPTHDALSAAVPDHPAWLTRVDGHAAWLNARAMELGGVTDATESAAGGELLRDAAGRATGLFVDAAMDAVAQALPPPSAQELAADLRHALARCAEAGLTGVHDMSVELDELAALERLEAQGELTLRVTVYLAGGAAGVGERLRQPPDREGRLRVVGVKYFADGALGSRGAALFDDYADRPGHRGLLAQSPERLAELAREAHDAGYQLAIHAIGDRGNAVALDAIEAAQGTDRARRHRIEHAQVLREADVGRFAALGVVASMQPTHATSDMPWAEARVGPARLRFAYAWRTLAQAGALLAFGSDAPVEDHRPALGLYAALTRQDADGAPPGGWRPEERLTIEDALLAFTRGPARALGDDESGVIRPGARADLTIVGADPRALAPAALRELRVLATVVDGRVVYRAR